jgi:putative ABC transport system permease protein
VDQFRFIRETDKGFDDKNMIVVKIRQSDQSSIEAFNEDVRKLQGVAAVDGSTYYPGIIETKYVFQVETDKGMEQTLVPMMLCGFDYFNAMSIQMKEGRGFDATHPEDQHYSFVINETAAKQFRWKEPLEKKIVGPLDGSGGAFREGEVIGVVRDFNFATLHSEIEPLIIFLNDDDWASQFIYIKTNPIHRSDLVTAIQRDFKRYWPNVPFEWEYLDTKYLSLYKNDYEVKSLFEIGLTISVLISCLGIFSISALLASLRIKEMGIRKVVGASSSQLFLLHIRNFGLFLLLALVLACPFIYFWSGSWLSNFAYHIDLNTHHFFVPGLLAMTMVLFTSGYHAVRNALVNPADTLKYE